MDIEFHNLLEPDAPTPEEEYRRFASSQVPFEAAFGKMMLELLDYLRRDVVGPRLIAEKDLFGPGIRFAYSDGHGQSVAVCVTVDYQDRSPLVDGLPLLHYRLSCESGRSEEFPGESRTHNVQTACEFIRSAIRECRGTM
jgi:hypothetical protein